MNIGLYNVDSSLPNLALMKISAYHKAKGDQVSWCGTPIEAMQYDKVYGSQIFTDSERWDAPNLEMGGSGYDKTKKLLPEIDDMPPDYSIYPECDYSIGFTTRGCIRKCSFCFVPIMEGNIKEYRTIGQIWRGKGDIVLYDNNILALPEKFREVIRFCQMHKIKVDFNQGLDVRLMNEDLTLYFLENIRYIKQPKFAFDDLAYKTIVENFCSKIQHLGHKINWYVYANKNWESALERCLILKRLSQKPYVMRDKSIAKDKKYVILAHWCNNVVGAFFKHDFWDHYQWYINQPGE
jgi:hypothetical protein